MFNQYIIRERESRYKMVKAIITILLAAMVAIPVGLLMNSGHSSTNSVMYTWGGESVQFNGNSVIIGFGNHLYPVSWTVSQISQSSSGSFSPFITTTPSINKVNMTHYSYRRIFNSYQNSAVLTEWGKGMRIAEIYTFMNNGIDASIAMENTGNVSRTFAGTFVLQAHSHKYANLFGYDPKGIKQTLDQNTNGYTINSNQWEFCQGNISVNWQQDISIFHLGTLVSNKHGSAVSLPFGPIQLSPNETYSIDPVIRPMLIIGGGGGGGQTAAQVKFTESGLPSGTSWSVTFNGVSSSSTTSTITFNEVTGKSYSYSIGTVYGYFSSPSSGSITVGTGGYTEGINFSPNPNTFYSVTFTESGLPSGTGWSVTLNGQEKSSSQSISFLENSGTYSYSVPTTNGANGTYSPDISSGSVNVHGNTTINIGFTLTKRLYAVTFTESGLPSNTYWNIFFNNSEDLGAESGQSITFYAYDGTFTYEVYTNPQSGGTMYLAMSGSGKIFNAPTTVNVNYAVSLGNLSVNGANGQQNPTYPNYYLAQQGFTFSVSYTNASAGDGIYFYGLTSGGTSVLLSNSSKSYGNASINPVGSGTSTWIWNDQPGYYTGFEAVMKYDGNTLNLYHKTLSVSISNQAYYIYDIFPVSSSRGTCYFSDTQGLGKIYNSTTGDVIGNLTQVGSMGIDHIISPSNEPLNGYTFSTSIYMGNKPNNSYGVWNETQTFSYINNTLGISPINNPNFIANQKKGDYVQGDSSNNYTNAYNGAQELWYATSFALGVAALAAVPPFDLILKAASIITSGVGQFIFANPQSSSIQYSTVYNTISDTINGTERPAFSYTTGAYPTSHYIGTIYNPIENASGGYSKIFGFTDSVGFSQINGNATLNYFIYTAEMTLIGINYAGGYLIPSGNTSLPPMYSTAISIPIYIASET